MYALNFVFTAKEEVKYEKIKQIDISLDVRNEFNIRESLQLVDAHRGIETLGVYMALDGNMEDEK